MEATYGKSLAFVTGKGETCGRVSGEEEGGENSGGTMGVVGKVPRTEMNLSIYSTLTSLK